MIPATTVPTSPRTDPRKARPPVCVPATATPRPDVRPQQPDGCGWGVVEQRRHVLLPAAGLHLTFPTSSSRPPPRRCSTRAIVNSPRFVWIPVVCDRQVDQGLPASPEVRARADHRAETSTPSADEFDAAEPRLDQRHRVQRRACRAATVSARYASSPSTRARCRTSPTAQSPTTTRRSAVRWSASWSKGSCPF